MAKFRTNHNSQQKGHKKTSGSAGKKGGTLRLIIGLIFVAITLYFLSQVKTDSWDSPTQKNGSGGADITLSGEKGNSTQSSFLPESTTGEVIHHKHYSLSYSEEHEQPEWVAYKLTEESLRKPNVKRAKRFNQDNAVSGRSAKHNDYTRSGYTRGHMAPAGDMAFSIEAMQESFFMSNMSPQVKECNGGIWRELEENVRDWAFDHDELYVVSGPLLGKGHIITKIGQNQVSVPDTYFKILLDIEGRDKKAIGFLIPNEKSTKPLKEYVASIDEIEEEVGINFFADFLDPKLEAELEKMKSTKGWKFDTKKFETRVRNWNKR